MAKKFSIKNRKKASLSEGFLDGEEEVSVTPEDTQPEVDVEDEPSEESDDDADIDDSEDDNIDISDEDDYDDEPSDEEDDEPSDEEAGVEKEPEEQQNDLQDTMQTLITAVQALTDQLAKKNDADAPAKAETDEPADNSDDEIVDDSEFEGDDENADDDSDAEFEGGDESSDENSDENSDEETSDESSDKNDDETTDETKSEAWNFFAKRGKPLHENSGYMIGKILAGRFDKLEPFIMAIAKQKIQNRIEGAKKEFRTEAYNRQYGEK